MALRLRYAAGVALAAAALAAVAAGLGGAMARESRGAAESPLGGEARCDAYAGLPAGWGAEARAGGAEHGASCVAWWVALIGGGAFWPASRPDCGAQASIEDCPTLPHMHMQ